MKSKKLFLADFILIVILTSFNSLSQNLEMSVHMPFYKGGFTALKDFIEKNLRYPEAAEKENIPGTVILSYLVNEKGMVDDIRVLRGINKECDSEAVRVARLITGWEPAVQMGEAVTVRVIMPVEFKSGISFENEKEIIVTGIITDKSNNKPIKGSLVLVKGTSIGAIADIKGWYSISVPGKEYELEYTSMGYETKIEKVGSNRIINAELTGYDFIIDFGTDQLR